MTDSREAFKIEFTAFMEKHSVFVDFVDGRHEIVFYAGSYNNPVVLRPNPDSELVDRVVDCIQ